VIARAAQSAPPMATDSVVDTAGEMRAGHDKARAA
jgi:hypothetical protein